jgi:hypothetical protein
MAVDQQVLSAKIDEVVQGDAELRTLLLEKFAKNDNAAVAFVGGFMRNADYTQKTQSVAGEKKKYEEQIALYQQNLEAAETDKTRILKDLANQKVTVAQANARLQSVKETYQLGDDDIPPMGDLIDTRKTGKVHDSTADLDERFSAFEKKFEERITRQLLPELAGMTDLDIIWANMRDEHYELTGKRLTAPEQRDILKTARDGGRKLTDVWEEKFDIGGQRKKVERDSIVKEERAKWDAELTAKRSQEAMEGIRPGAPDETGLRLSPVLHKQFVERGNEPVEIKPGEHTRVQTATIPSAVQREGLTGGERAAKAYLERRAAGVPMGAPREKKTA